MVKLWKTVQNLFCRHKRMVIVNKGVIKAVHDEDLENFLESLGLLKKIKSGRMKCALCDGIVTLDNFQCIYPENGTIHVCCSSSACYEKLVMRGRVVNE